MVNYICRTCLYLSENELSFRKVEKVKLILETFVPEIKNYIGKYTLICEQCYYFLKNVEKFKAKCIETQKKLCSMNVGTTKNNSDSHPHNFTDKELHTNELSLHRKRSQDDSRSETELKKKKQDFTALVGKQSISHLDQNSVNSPDNNTGPFHYILSKSQNREKNSNSISHSSVYDELLQLFNHDKDSDENCNNNSNQNNGSNREVILNNEFVISLDDDSNSDSVDNVDSDEYMTRKDLVAAGILPDNDRGSFGEEKDPSRDDCFEVEVNRSDTEDIVLSDNICRGSKPKKKKSLAANEENTAIIKLEKFDDENPGFFNKQSEDGFYKCRLCTKHYKSSKGLYKHTKDKHEEQIKIHHCNHCNFFTLWKSALTKHYSAFHEDFSTPENNETMFICYHCSFESRSKFHLSRHIQDVHEFEKIRCNLCRKRFSNSKLFAEHVKKEHTNVTPSPTCCPECCMLFITQSNYKKHIREKHGDAL